MTSIKNIAGYIILQSIVLSILLWVKSMIDQETSPEIPDGLLLSIFSLFFIFTFLILCILFLTAYNNGVAKFNIFIGMILYLIFFAFGCIGLNTPSYLPFTYSNLIINTAATIYYVIYICVKPDKFYKHK